MSDKLKSKSIFPTDEEDEDVTDTTAPLLLSEKVKCDLKDYVFYMLRLTPENDNYGYEQVLEFMEDLSEKGIWFVSEELSKKGIKHYHCVFAYLNNLDPRVEVKNWLVGLFPNTWKKQDGNKRYNLQEVEDLTKAFTYTSKDGDYKFGKGINGKYIEYVNSKSFQKKDSRVGQLLVARDDYVKGVIDDKDLFDIICTVYISTSNTGSLNMATVKSFMVGAKATKDVKYRDQLFKSMCL